jgi:hypothetical protein
MTMAKRLDILITSGRVTFEKTMQLAQYEPARAAVELFFTVSEGDDVQVILDDVTDLVRNHVNETLRQERRR